MAKFKDSDYLKKWLAAALVRAIKTFAQSAVAMIAVGSGFVDVDWLNVASVSGVAALLSILTSIGGLPEVESANFNE